MSGGCAIESARTLFNLPRPLDPDQGKIWTGAAYGFRESRKRKRSEIVVGVDGDSLNVYNVRSSRLVISHALPPQTYLTAPPCSILTQISEERGSRRTYLAIRNDLSRNDSQICRLINLPKSRSSTERLLASRSSSSSVPLGSPKNPVVYLDAVWNSSSSLETLDAALGLITIQKNGDITCMSEDLSRTIWSKPWSKLVSESTSSPQASQVVVDYAIIATAQSACDGFLKDRLDILASMAPKSSFAHDHVLCLVTSPAEPTASSMGDQTFWVFSFHSKTTQSGTDQNQCRFLLTCPLSISPTSRSTGWSERSYDFDPQSGILQQSNGHSLITYNLSSGILNVVSELAEPRTKLTSFLALSSYLSAVSTEHSCSIYNTRYQSRQASLSLTEAKQSEQGRKRKRSRIDPPLHELRLCQYFPSLKFAVGISGNVLVAISLVVDNSKASSSMNKYGRLIDSIGRGIGTPVEDDSISNKKSLDEFARTRNTKSFDRLFFSLIRQQNQSRMSTSSPNDGNMETSDHETTTTDHSQAVSGNQTKQRLARYALQRAFRLNFRDNSHGIQHHSNDTILQIDFFSEKVFGWLSRNGYLTAEEIRSALSRSQSSSQLVDQISSISLVRALANRDPGLDLLSELILSSSHLDLQGHVEATRILMQSFDVQPVPVLITDATQASSLDPNSSASDPLEADLDAATTELALAQSTLIGGGDDRATALRTTLTRLPLMFAPTALVKILKSQLPTYALLQLVDLLRFELAQGGWTTRYVDTVYPAAVPPPPSQDSAIALICTLLNCTLDALGTGGWITGRTPAHSHDETDDADTLIAFLRAETSATLEGVQEASFFKGFLKDFLRFSQTGAPAHKKITDSMGDTGGVVADPASTGAQDVMLPLGLKRALHVSTARVQAGGEVKPRSRRETRALLSRQVGPYAFERIRI